MMRRRAPASSAASDVHRIGGAANCRVVSDDMLGRRRCGYGSGLRRPDWWDYPDRRQAREAWAVARFTESRAGREHRGGPDFL